MRDGPDFATAAALMGDPARANMLAALMDGRALTAGELAAEAGVAKQTASLHLAKLIDAGLLAREVQGRHHYFRLSGPEVAAALEALMALAQGTTGRRVRPGPRDQILRKARVCYDHLAGELGVLLFDAMRARGLLLAEGAEIRLSDRGRGWLAAAGVALDPGSRRPECRACLDWSVRTHHLAGRVGAATLDRIFAAGWARRDSASRAVVFSADGERALRAWIAAA